MALSGGIDITQDRILTSGEKLTNPKVNEATTFTARLKPNSVTPRELAGELGVATFDTIALFQANTEAYTNGQYAQATGYYTAGAGDAGPRFTADTSDTTTADNGFSCIVDANGLRWKRTFAEQINIKWAGYRSSADGTETYATANDTAWAAVKTYLDSNPGSVLIPADGDNVYYYSADQEAAANCIYTLDGTMKKKADVLAHGFEFTEGADNITLKGFGKIHGNAVVDQVRAGGNGILATDNENITIKGRIQVDDCEGHAVNIRQPVGLTIDGMYIRNTYGSVKSGNTTSGVNMDGIHLYNPNDAVITNCNIISIDDCIAVTMLDAYTADCKGVVITNCVTENVKAENSAASGDGSNELVIGAGYRIAEDHSNTSSTRRLRDVTIANGFHQGGDAGMLLGTTGLTTTTKWVERLQVSNMHFQGIATDADMSLNRALSAGIWCRAIGDSVFNDCTFSECGVPGIMTDICDNVEFNNMVCIGGTVDNANYPVGSEFERAHYVIRGSQNASDRVYFNNIRSVDADGAGIAVIHDGGSGKEITDLKITGVVDNPNQHGGTQDDHSAVYLVNMDAGEITHYDVEVINFTPSGNVIEMARSSSAVLIQKLAPLNLTKWHSDVYAAAGNWFTRIQLFTPTFTVVDHFEGYSGVLKIDQGTTHITGTAQAGSTTTITLASGETSLNDAFNGLTINLTGGTGSGQSKTITDYVGSTKVATVDSAWSTDPDATTTYEIEDAGGDGIYSVPLGGSALDDKHVCAEFYIHVDSGSVSIVEDSTLGVVTDTIDTTGSWLQVKKIWAPYQTSTRIGFVAAETPTTFYLGPIKLYEL